MSASMRFFLCFSALCLITASANCPKVTCVQGTQNAGLDSAALFFKMSNGEWAFDAAPVTVQSDYCVVAYTKDCEISAYGWTPSLGLLPSPPGECQKHSDNRIYCACNDAHNCHLDFIKYTSMAQAKGMNSCPMVDTRPSHIPLPTPCCAKVKCLQGTQDIPGQDSYGLLLKKAERAYVYDQNPITAEAFGLHCGLSNLCRRMDYQPWTPSCSSRATTASTGTRLFCVCNDADNCHLDHEKYTQKAMLLGMMPCPDVPKPSNYPQPSECATFGVGGVAAEEGDRGTTKANNATSTEAPMPIMPYKAASGLFVWTGLMAIVFQL